jgi:prepilin-type N-terminal cleavage/methylation domain-containing protein
MSKYSEFRNPHPAMGGSKYSAFRIPHSAMGKRGFTLIEIIILIVIAGIILPVIVVPFVASVKESGKPEMVNTAMYLAHQKMEEFTKYDYSNAALNPIALTAYANAPIANYQWQWEIILVDNNFNTSGTDVGYKRIFVRLRDPENDTYAIYSVVTNFP